MSVSVICSACGTRLKLPPGRTKRKARCPKCGARIDLTTALDASAYHPSLTLSTQPEREEDPLPYLDLNPKPIVRPEPLSLDDDAPLSLDDETPLPALLPPAAQSVFRAPARVTRDSAALFTGPCAAVFVPHGLFLEVVPQRPFLYAPVGTPVEPAGRHGLSFALPESRTLVLELTGRRAARLARDAAAFVTGAGPTPEARLYQGASLRAIVLAAALVLAATAIAVFAYLAGRNGNTPDTVPDPPAQPAPKHEPTPLEPKPSERPRRPPTAIDRAYADGMFRFDDGPDDVTALAVSPDGSTLVIGYKNGTTRVWEFEQAAFDPIVPGPRCEGAPTRIQFDSTRAIIYITCDGGTVVAPVHNPPAMPVKISGEAMALFSSPGGERFAAVRGSSLVERYVPSSMLVKPSPKGKDAFVHTLPREEVMPADVKVRVAATPRKPTFLAWHPAGKLLAGQPDGSILALNTGAVRFAMLTSAHKAPVRVWSASPATWDIATGDDNGVVGIWANKALVPSIFPAATAAIRQLSFGPSGAHIAVADAAGGISVWELWEPNAILKVKRKEPVKALAFGPNDDLLLLSNGRSVELWSIAELASEKAGGNP